MPSHENMNASDITQTEQVTFRNISEYIHIYSWNNHLKGGHEFTESKEGHMRAFGGRNGKKCNYTIILKSSFFLIG